jgi:hypothetical protein
LSSLTEEASAAPDLTEPSDDGSPGDRDRRAQLRAWAKPALTGLAFVVVWVALVVPNRLDQLSVTALVRIPIEGLVVVAICVYLPSRARTIAAAVFGVLMAVLAIAKVLDMGFYQELDRPFNPITDWGYVGPATGVFRDTYGSRWTHVAEIGVVVFAVVLLVLVPWALVRVTRLAARYRDNSVRTISALGGVWMVCVALGLHLVPGVPIASDTAAGVAYQQVTEAHSALHDRAAFAAMLREHDPLRGVPDESLLRGLRGKDVLFVFVESYGRIAIQDSANAGAIDAELNAGSRQLDAAGFSSRSGFLTSPTFGGISWLAHSTLQSGLWIDNQQRYDQLMTSSRFTLSDAFKRAGWRTVADDPSHRGAWPQGKSFYHYDQLYNASNVGYTGPKFTYAAMPDQYVLSAFQKNELAQPNHRPVMAEIDLVSSHTPWAPLPHLIPWSQVGDGSVYDPQPAQGENPHLISGDSTKVTAAYGQSIQYSLNSLISFVKTFHDNNLVLVMLGDHQPATTVNGSGTSHDVPISIIAHDPGVLDQISSWGWNPGLLPHPNAPVWGMDAFRDRFLAAYSSG